MKINIMIIILLLAGILLTACGQHSKASDNSDMNAKGNSAEEENDQEDRKPNEDKEDAYKVVIDPGHGGKDKGATGADGHYEKEFTLSLGKEVANLLEDEPDIEVLMTRDNDSFISQESRDRPNYANEEDADIFISLHQNTFDDPDVSGTESFYYDEESRSFAETMQTHVTEATGFNDRGAGKENLFVTRDTDMPAVLIEVGYLSNPEDQDKMQTEAFQKQVAESIVDGIKAYQKS